MGKETYSKSEGEYEEIIETLQQQHMEDKYQLSVEADAQIQALHTEYEEKMAGLSNKLQSATAQIAKLQLQVNDTASTIPPLSQNHKSPRASSSQDEVKQKNDTLQVTNARLIRENSELLENYAELEIKNSDLQKENSELEIKNSDLQKENSELEIKNIDLQTENTKLVEKLVITNSEIDNLKLLLRDKEDELNHPKQPINLDDYVVVLTRKEAQQSNTSSTDTPPPSFFSGITAKVSSLKNVVSEALFPPVSTTETPIVDATANARSSASPSWVEKTTRSNSPNIDDRSRK